MASILPELDLNLSFLYEIADGNNEFIIDSINMFLQQTPDLIQTINNAITNKDWQLAASAAHSLKPNFGYFGMLLCQAIMQKVETMARTGAPDVELLALEFSKLHAIISPNIAMLEKIKAEKEAAL
ncbi:MAG: Hpt domain-containing protein [Mucilaginibacter sp.]